MSTVKNIVCGLPTPSWMGLRNSKGQVELILFVTVILILHIPYAWTGLGKHCYLIKSDISIKLYLTGIVCL